MSETQYDSRSGMDLSEIAVGHGVKFTELHIKHTIELSPVAASVARELRHCVIVIAIGISIVTISKCYLASRTTPKSGRS